MNYRIAQIWKDGINWTNKNKQFYRLFNKDLKAPNIKGLKRPIQSTVLRLRNECFDRCSHGCQTKCEYCGADYSTQHYVLECPRNRPLYGYLMRHVGPDHGTVDPVEKLITVLTGEDRGGYQVLSEMIGRNPPKTLCKVNKSHSCFTDNGPWVT